MKVYLDVAFLVNFLFDAEIIFLTLVLFSRRIVYHRIIFAAFLGGLQGVFVFFPYFRILSLPPISFLASAVMVIISLKPACIKDFFEGYIFFLLTGFLFGGAMTFLRLKAIFGVLLVIPAYFGIVGVRSRIYKKRTKVTLFYNGKKIEKDAVYDSGNSVFYLGKPVIFGGRQVFSEILNDDFSENNILNAINPKDMCIVPYKSMGKSGITAGIRLENAVIGRKDFKNAVICLFDGDLKDEVVLNGVMF